MPRWRIAFKYKLALSISAIILGVLGGAFLLVETLMEKYVVAEIEKDLIGTRYLVSRLIGERRIRLGELAMALAGDSLTRIILTDKTLNRLTRDDIVSAEILPNFPQLELLAVLDADGSVRAINDQLDVLAPTLEDHWSVRRSLDGRSALGFIRRETSFLQIAAIPIGIGPSSAREVIGAVVVGMPWSAADLNSIRELSHAEIAFFDSAGIFLSSGPPFDLDHRPNGSAAAAWKDLSGLHSSAPATVTAGVERFIVIKVDEPDAVSPSYLVARSLDRQLEFLNQMQRWLLQLGIGGILIGCAVSFILALGISRPIRILQTAFRRVAQGNFQQPAAVYSRDEFSELAGAFNRMQDGLVEREKMKQALLMAEEVQRNLLPASPPRIQHLDVAGASIYCNAIGGDYYDFLDGPAGESTLRVALGDVCGHGTAAALLMATGRALLRSRCLQAGPIEAIVSDVNRELALDIKDTGRFMTLFLLEMDAEARQIRWVRAGHEPAILYNPATETFENLTGEGLALGVDAATIYTARVKSGLSDGQIIVVGTDGLWEARNPSGEMFGKDRLFSLLRRHARGSATDIAGSIFERLKEFRDTAEFEDDATLVVVKAVWNDRSGQLDTSDKPSQSQGERS